MIKKTKKYSIQVLFLLFTIYTTAQTPVTIVKPEPPGTSYTVTGTETLVATQSITLKPNTWIKSGSTFVARIIPDAYIPFTLSNENFVFTRSFQAPVQSSTAIAKNSDVIETVIYYDGLGRPIQNINIKASREKQDIVTHFNYDNSGKQDKDYLPHMVSTGAVASYRTGAEISTNNYYITNYAVDINSTTPNPFSQKEFEYSPLNRVMKQAAPGYDWRLNGGHEIKLDYQTNTATDSVKLYNVTTVLNADGMYVPSVTSTANYIAGQLYKTITKDENWQSGKNNTTEEFKNKEGQLILKRSYTNYDNPTQLEESHNTYYIYDHYGNLTYVLPPKANGGITEAILNDLCYRYRYDSRNRLVEKKLPGKGWEYIVYDKLDRPILTQDANLRASKKWIFTKYDIFSRPIYTGEYLNTLQTTRKLVQDEANKVTAFCDKKLLISAPIAGTNVYYSNNAFPIAGIDLFTINYYDNYDTIDLDGGTTAVSYGITPITNAKGLSTCSKVRVLGTSNWITNVIYYDTKGRPIYNYNKNSYLKVTSTIKSQFNFGGKVLETTSTHKYDSDAAITIVDTYAYDHVGRMLTQIQKINTQTPELIVSNTYDNLGQLITKGVGGKITQPRLQTVNFTYNVRGWLKGINDSDTNTAAITTGTGDLFGFQINYNKPSTGKALYNGNISQTFWKTANADTSLKSYNYSYDALNRLTSATDNLTKFNETVSYDKNGNIMKLKRLGEVVPGVPLITNPTDFGVMDDLTYTYNNGNQLMKVADAAPIDSFGFKDDPNALNQTADTVDDYTYDSNGNMKTDINKGITAIAYNYLNLPTKITLTAGTIDYVYDATGVKQQKIVNGITTDYAESFIYENNILKSISQPEGYISKNSGVFDYIYQYKDHLGNVRLSYGDSNNNGSITSAEIIEENNYYPFGLKHKGYNNTTSLAKGDATAQKYKYNGKELQDELGLNMYDYGARNYDPALGRWMNIDPLAEKSRRFSPYTYALNNPVFFIDPDGMEAMSPIYGSKGQYLGTDSQGFKGEVIFMNENMFSLLNFGQKEGGISHDMAMQFGETLPSVIGNSKDSFTQGESDMVNNAITDIVSKTDDKGFDMSNLHNSKTSSDFTAPDRTTDKANQYWGPSSNDASQPVFGKDEVPATTKGNVMTFNLYSSYLNKKEQFTVGNIQNAAVHEGGHLTGNIPGEGTGHAKAYELQMNHSTWQQTTKLWRINLTRAYKEVKAGNL